jgi:tRNA threonylcarbamoyladenosine biosynthesis protein TsaE
MPHEPIARRAAECSPPAHGASLPAGGSAPPAGDCSSSDNDASGNDALGNDALGNDASANDASANDATGSAFDHFDDQPEQAVAVWSFIVEDEVATERLGALLAQWLPDGAVVSLNGTLGAGKTRLVQALAEAAGADRRAVVSPTFTLCHAYQGRRVVHHLDAYRLRDSDEFLALGPEEFLDGPGLTLIEWGEKVDDALPRRRWIVQIDVLDEHRRRFTISVPRSRDAAGIAALRQLVAAWHSEKSPS